LAGFAALVEAVDDVPQLGFGLADKAVHAVAGVEQQRDADDGLRLGDGGALRVDGGRAGVGGGAGRAGGGRA
jgi:hypothetical protein